MNYNHSGRITLIAIILFAALMSIFPPSSLFRSDLTFWQKLNLKPGIDMVGGTSLTYDIKQPEGGYHGEGSLAESVATALKKRVDPEGVKNLIWRPQGDTQLEIQLPRSTENVDAAKIRNDFIAAQQAFESTNVRQAEVVRTVETLKGADRDKRLAELAGDNPQRQDLFKKLATTYDAIKAAEARGDHDAEALSGIEYNKLKAQIEADNIQSADLQAIADKPKADREKELTALKAHLSANQAKAVDSFVQSYLEFAKVKDTIDDAATLKRLLRGSGVLEFHILAATTDAGYTAMKERLESQGPAPQPGDEMRWFLIDQPDQFGGFAREEYNGKWYALAWITPAKSMVNPPGQQKWALENATPELDSNGGGRAVGFEFDPLGGSLFGELTGNNIGKPLSVMLDQKIISAANINSKITNKGIITRGGGGYSDAEYKYLLSTLKAGSLPATLSDEPISERTIGPQLGADNLRRGLLACVLGLGVVAIFLFTYYYLAGLVAAFAVVLNVVLILATMAAINATFTLPGVAGIVLTIGAAVDANVLIFERLREEQQRGVGLKGALRNAYSRAASAIVDSNATTLITAALLCLLGTEEVKGFGVTLLIGLVWSLFTSLYVTRTVLDLLVDKVGIKNLGSIPLSFPSWDRLLKPNIDWMGKAWMFMLFSGLFISLGLAGFFVKLHSGELLDVEFTRGTSVQFALTEKIDIEKIRERISHTSLPSPSVVAVGTEGKSYEVVTADENAGDVTKAILAAMRQGEGSLLNIELPSKFDHVDQKFDEALDTAIHPIGKDPITVDDYSPPNQEIYRGGVAIVLKDLSPKLSTTEISERIRRQQLQPLPGGAQPPYVDFKVFSPAGVGTPTDLAVVMVAPGTDTSFDQKPENWKNMLAIPMWDMVKEGVNKPAQLQSVRSIDPTIAGDTQSRALAVLILSILVTMIFIWLRFGNLKYGTATVLAMFHDTLLAVGAVGLAHYMVQWTPWLADALLVEPFRVNLTLVAGILTVMSYSMIDTIVVFDRIRENRGKFGHLSMQVVNDSINQTLSRTLLTVGTTVATLLGMYIFGGSGIHGFTFVLLVGILVGTYSSIAIAAPFLLMGVHREAKNSESAAVTGQLQQS